ncbi:cache domain-containing sensor histidine kinase [Paenibacillus chungangensis]|uniref:histidine kinase n=1 Tax=Paenibacillus chungangensis TaxID=696535 RepID=A0ABW3HPE2_9BACL
MHANTYMLPIRLKLTVVFIVLISITGGLIGITTFINWGRSTEEAGILLSRQVLFSKKNYMETYLEERINATLPIWFQKDVQTFIKMQDQSDPLLFNRISDILKNEMHLKNDLSALFLYKKDGEIIYQSNGKAIKELTNSNNMMPVTGSVNPKVLPPHEQTYINDGDQVISIIRGITVDGKMEPDHYLLIDIAADVFHKLTDTALWNKGYVFVVDTNGRFIYHPEKEMLGQTFQYHDKSHRDQGYFIETFEGRKMLFTTLEGEVSGWTYYSALPKEDLSSHMIQNRNVTVVLIVMLIVAAVIIAYLFASKLTRPIISLKQMMLSVEKGNFDVALPVRTHDEIGYLTSSFNRMACRLKELTEEIYISRINETEAALKRLQAQINPHFLYNTLDAIHALAAIEGIRPIQKIVSSLASLFRYNIGDDNRLVPLNEEIKYLKVYLDIQKVRFQDRFDMNILVDRSVESVPILKFILQPLVENAFKHGVEKLSGSGKVWISALKEDSYLVIRIVDNGIGMSEDCLNQVRQELKKSETQMSRPAGRSIGLVNVHQRLRLHYGNLYSMEVESKLHAGTTIELKIPVDSYSISSRQ